MLTEQLQETYFKIFDAPINVQEILDAVRSPACGGLSLFLGTVRNHNQGKVVQWLEYEAYGAMAVKKMQEIAQEAMQKFPAKKIAMAHRVGKLEIGDVAVAIAVVTPHRREAFEACQFCIDTLKKSAPIWKKEIFEDGEVWVDACQH
jgi:molybdopterin synthase catalytic subunit